VGVTSQVNQGNLAELEALAPILEEAGVLGWQLQLTLPLGRAEENRHLIAPPSHDARVAARAPPPGAPPGLRPHLTDNIGYCTSDDLELRTIQGGFPRPWLGCRAGLDALGITSDGRVKGCLALPDTCTEGNVREESLARSGATRIDSATTAATRPTVVRSVRGVRRAQRCRGGCTATAYAMHGKPGTSSHCSDVKDCKKHNNWIARVFGLIFHSNRAACIGLIREEGYPAFAADMAASKRQSLPR
jgi:radical SAM protein with 4Fe4S-binding SPASM domain